MDLFTRHTQNNFDWWAVLALTLTVFLLPFFFIPSQMFPVQFTKTLVLFIGVLLAFVAFVLGRLKDGTLTIPRSYLLLSVWLLPLAYGLSALVSGGGFSLSFTGRQFEVDTFSYVIVAALLTTLVSILFKEKEHILRAYAAILASFAIVALFQVARLFIGPEFLSFGIFTDGTGNLVGKWYDLAIFAGFVAVLSLTTLESLALRGVAKWALYLLMLISLFLLAIINFSPVWYVIAVFSLGFFMASLLRGLMRSHHGTEGVHMTARGMKQVSPSALAVLVISVLFIFAGAGISQSLSTSFGISHLEARPSWQSTMEIAQATLSTNPLFGSGPNTFVGQWLQFKQDSINLTPFWNLDFIAGIGLVPTSFITTGLVGGFAWLLFLGLFVFVGVRSVMRIVGEDPLAYFATLSSFIGAAYFWILTVVYVPNVVVLSLAFLLTGLLIASLRHYPATMEATELHFARDPRVGFVTVFVFTLMLLGAFGSLYVVGVRYVSASYFQRALIAGNIEGSLSNAKVLIQNALALSNMDQFHVFAASVNLAEMQKIVGATEGEPEALRAQFQTELAEAVQHAQAATAISPVNYQNWTMLGNVYRSVVPLKLEGAYDNAKAAYERARTLAPKDPSVPFLLSQLEIANSNPTAARAYLDEALKLKPNYLDAIFLAAQLELNAGDVAKAITSVEAAALFEPNNPVIFYQLGLLYFGNNEIDKSIPAFERAVSLSPTYSNARYFLGLGYSRTNQTEKAIAQFEEVQRLNPDNTEVAGIIDNLRSGVNPLPNVEENPVKTGDGQPVEEDV